MAFFSSGPFLNSFGINLPVLASYSALGTSESELAIASENDRWKTQPFFFCLKHTKSNRKKDLKYQSLSWECPENQPVSLKTELEELVLRNGGQIGLSYVSARYYKQAVV